MSVILRCLRGYEGVRFRNFKRVCTDGNLKFKNFASRYISEVPYVNQKCLFKTDFKLTKKKI